jgi:GntR family transcriptional regulator, transcriptional repressor for pyruvate dehydrogenase complex
VLLDYRRLIESLIARTAAERRDPSDVAAIKAAVERYTEASSRADARIADHALHQAIARATHPPDPEDRRNRCPSRK